MKPLIKERPKTNEICQKCGNTGHNIYKCAKATTKDMLEAKKKDIQTAYKIEKVDIPSAAPAFSTQPRPRSPKPQPPVKIPEPPPGEEPLPVISDKSNEDLA